MTHLPPSELRIHPLIKAMPRLAEDDPRYDAMRATWQESGLLDPIWITPDHQIVNGRHRYWYACKAKLPEVPVLVIEPHEISSLVLAGISGKNHASKGQQAYLAAPYLEQAFAEARTRRLAILSAKGKCVLPPVPNAEQLGARLGIGRDLLFQARRLHDLFAKSPELRELWEPKILAPVDAIGLGGALSGIAGGASVAGKPKAESRNGSIYNWTDAWRSVSTAAKRGWKNWSQPQKERALEVVVQATQSLPDPLLGELETAIKAELKARKAASADAASN
jgi:hypothetical protein